MSDNSTIEWTDATWNPLIGCSKISPGCKNCYAMSVARIRMYNPAMKDRFAGVVTPKGTALNWTGKINVDEQALLLPLTWKKPRRIFVNSMSDLFHENVTDETRDKVFAVMASASQHTYQILTKRPERAAAWFKRVSEKGSMHANLYQSALIDFYSRNGVDLANEYQVPTRPTGELRFIYDSACGIDPKSKIEDREHIKDLPECHWRQWPLSNVWLGVSVENQATADERILHLLRTPAAVRWLSCEPLLGQVNIHPHLGIYEHPFSDGRKELWSRADRPSGIHWVVVGGESGAKARPMHPDWARSLRDQCQAAGVPFFFKQWGEWAPSPDGGLPDALPMDNPKYFHYFDDAPCKVWRFGKKAAGRNLDGRTWDEFPNTEVLA